MQAYRTSITAEIINFALTLVLALALVTWSPQASSALIALLVANAASLVFSYSKVRAHARLVWGSVQEGWALLKESLPMFVSAATGALMANAGTYILGVYSTPAQAAFYGTAERMVTTALGLLVPASQVLLPRFSRMASQQGASTDLQGQQRKAIGWVTAAGALAFLCALGLAPWVLPLLLGEKFRQAASVLQWFSPIFLVSAFNNSVALYVLMPHRKDRWITVSGLANAVCSLALMRFMAQAHGAHGIAASRVFMELMVAVLMVMLWRRCQQEDPRPRG